VYCHSIVPIDFGSPPRPLTTGAFLFGTVKSVFHGHGNLPSGHRRTPAINATIKTKTSAQIGGKRLGCCFSMATARRLVVARTNKLRNITTLLNPVPARNKRRKQRKPNRKQQKPSRKLRRPSRKPKRLKYLRKLARAKQAAKRASEGSVTAKEEAIKQLPVLRRQDEVKQEQRRKAEADAAAEEERRRAAQLAEERARAARLEEERRRAAQLEEERRRQEREAALRRRSTIERGEGELICCGSEEACEDRCARRYSHSECRRTCAGTAEHSGGRPCFWWH
jgi:hypothetical protein